jgi:hypothetical protein
MRTILGVVVVAALAGAMMFRVRPQAQEVEESDQPDVSEAELTVYLDVYGAMQADHDLTIEDAIGRHGNGITLTDFRDIERRIQRQDRLVERVRQALLENARKRTGALAPSAARTKPSDDDGQ